MECKLLKPSGSSLCSFELWRWSLWILTKSTGYLNSILDLLWAPCLIYWNRSNSNNKACKPNLESIKVFLISANNNFDVYILESTLSYIQATSLLGFILLLEPLVLKQPHPRWQSSQLLKTMVLVTLMMGWRLLSSGLMRRLLTPSLRRVLPNCFLYKWVIIIFYFIKCFLFLFIRLEFEDLGI